MRIEQERNIKTPDYRKLNEQQSSHFRNKALETFKANYYKFGEFEDTRVLFSARIIDGNKENKMFVVTMNGVNIAAYYDFIDLEFIHFFEKSLDEEKKENPVNSFIPVFFTNPREFEKNEERILNISPDVTLPALITTHHLKPGRNCQRAIVQTEVFNPDNGSPIIEIWTGVTKKNPTETNE